MHGMYTIKINTSFQYPLHQRKDKLVMVGIRKVKHHPQASK